MNEAPTKSVKEKRSKMTPKTTKTNEKDEKMTVGVKPSVRRKPTELKDARRTQAREVGERESYLQLPINARRST